MATKKPAAISKSLIQKIPAISSLPKVGDRMPGGVVGAVMLADGKRPAYALIVADESTTKSLAWGPYGTEIKGLSDWDGLANTGKLVKAATDHPAAQYCASLVIDGCNDFYLPARHEARLLAPSAARLFKDGWYWTSSQSSANGAFVQGFSGGYQYYLNKDYEWRVRAVRRFIID